MSSNIGCYRGKYTKRSLMKLLRQREYNVSSEQRNLLERTAINIATRQFKIRSRNLLASDLQLGLNLLSMLETSRRVIFPEVKSSLPNCT